MNALIVVDVQNDFCPNGKLAVPEGDKIVPLINSIMPLFDAVILTQDWHPQDHLSFASNHIDMHEYDTIDMDYGPQVLWPDHCVQSTPGADFHPKLDTHFAHAIIRKGFRKHIDSYSGFTENDQVTKTGLQGLLTSLNIVNVFVCGLATDFCVKWTSIDSASHGFNTFMIQDASRGIDLNDSMQKALFEMDHAGVHIINVDQIKENL